MNAGVKIMKIILLILILVLAAWMLVRRFERSQMYFPQPELEFTPADIGLAYREAELNTSDGCRLHGWWIPNVRARGSLIFCHGNAGNISHRLESIRVFHQLGLNVLIFDYRGFGRSSGRPSEKGTYLDAVAAYEYLTRDLKIPPEEIVIFGRSLGGAVAVELARRKKAAALICESTFTSAEDMGRFMYPYLPVKFLISNKYDSVSKVGELTLPKLFLHSRRDDVVPYEQGERLYRGAAAPKKFTEILGGHGDGFLETGELYRRTLEEFLAENLPGS